ncbi:hypothetical protein SeLEV6574_g01451 [Synchytrium endobioticum]|nr:hypothetical protein SeLEV6574_g01451 [Synchytrium endobioticum]
MDTANKCAAAAPADQAACLCTDLPAVSPDCNACLLTTNNIAAIQLEASIIIVDTQCQATGIVSANAQGAIMKVAMNCQNAMGVAATAAAPAPAPAPAATQNAANKITIPGDTTGCLQLPFKTGNKLAGMLGAPVIAPPPNDPPAPAIAVPAQDPNANNTVATLPADPAPTQDPNAASATQDTAGLATQDPALATQDPALATQDPALATQDPNAVALTQALSAATQDPNANKAANPAAAAMCLGLPFQVPGMKLVVLPPANPCGGSGANDVPGATCLPTAALAAQADNVVATATVFSMNPMPTIRSAFLPAGYQIPPYCIPATNKTSAPGTSAMDSVVYGRGSDVSWIMYSLVMAMVVGAGV